MSFLVSCISTKHSLLKELWHASDRYTRLPRKVRGSAEKPKADLGGCLALVAEDGTVTAVQAVNQPSGLLQMDGEILAASRNTIHSFKVRSFDPPLVTHRRDSITSPLFNALHTVRSSSRGLLVASTGLDLILELDLDGTVLWQWWAHDHGLDETPLGRKRQVDRSSDFRTIPFGTLQQATHVNSAIEAPDGTILATLFHQGMVIAIDRQNGDWRPIVTDLPHVHSVRMIDERFFSVVDTEQGRVLVVNYVSREIVATQTVDTNWLQDGLYDAAQNRWLLVDGEKSRIVRRGGLAGDGAETIFQLNPEWRLYEVLPLR